jgi:chromosome segregation ATPase
MEQRSSAHDQRREQRLAELLDAIRAEQTRQRQQLEPAAQEISNCKAELSRLVIGLSKVMEGRGELVALEDRLAENLRLLRETGQIDQALHGLTGAIHLLTARGQQGGRAA